LLHPAADPGVRRVSGSAPALVASEDARSSRSLPSPRRSFAPLEGCSPRVAAPRHRGRCLLAVFTTSRPCSTFGSGTLAGDCSSTRALSFLGFVPPPRSFRTTAKLAAIVRGKLRTVAFGGPRR
jgi:hypothetical protein